MGVKLKFAKDYYPIQAVAPEGRYVATCKDVENFDYERNKVDDPSETELVAVTRFLFRFEGENGRKHEAHTFELDAPILPSTNLLKFLVQWVGISPVHGWSYYEAMVGEEFEATMILEHPNEKGTYVSLSHRLYKLLSDWAGNPLETGWGFECDLIGLEAQIEVVHREIEGKTVAQINSISPVDDQKMILKLLDDSYHQTNGASGVQNSAQAWNPDLDLMAEVNPF